jgi:hypothetical protein
MPGPLEGRTDLGPYEPGLWLRTGVLYVNYDTAPSDGHNTHAVHG